MSESKSNETKDKFMNRMMQGFTSSLKDFNIEKQIHDALSRHWLPKTEHNKKKN